MDQLFLQDVEVTSQDSYYSKPFPCETASSLREKYSEPLCIPRDS